MASSVGLRVGVRERNVLTELCISLTFLVSLLVSLFYHLFVLLSLFSLLLLEYVFTIPVFPLHGFYAFCSSQVFYYLGELNDSLSYALGAGSLFDVSEDSDYVHTLLGMKIHNAASCFSYEK